MEVSFNLLPAVLVELGDVDDLVRKKDAVWAVVLTGCNLHRFPSEQDFRANKPRCLPNRSGCHSLQLLFEPISVFLYELPCSFLRATTRNGDACCSVGVQPEDVTL